MGLIVKFVASSGFLQSTRPRLGWIWDLDHGKFDLEVRDLRLQFKIADAHRKGSGINDASLLWLFSNPKCSASPDRTSRDYDRNSLIERSVFVCQKEV